MIRSVTAEEIDVDGATDVYEVVVKVAVVVVAVDVGSATAEVVRISFILLGSRFSLIFTSSALSLAKLFFTPFIFFIHSFVTFSSSVFTSRDQIFIISDFTDCSRSCSFK